MANGAVSPGEASSNTSLPTPPGPAFHFPGFDPRLAATRFPMFPTPGMPVGTLPAGGMMPAFWSNPAYNTMYAAQVGRLPLAQQAPRPFFSGYPGMAPFSPYGWPPTFRPPVSAVAAPIHPAMPGVVSGESAPTAPVSTGRNSAVQPLQPSATRQSSPTEVDNQVAEPSPAVPVPDVPTSNDGDDGPAPTPDDPVPSASELRQRALNRDSPPAVIRRVNQPAELPAHHHGVAPRSGRMWDYVLNVVVAILLLCIIALLLRRLLM